MFFIVPLIFIGSLIWHKPVHHITYDNNFVSEPENLVLCKYDHCEGEK